MPELPVATQLQQLLEPDYPALVLDIEQGATDVTATVYQSCEPFDPIESLQITTGLARSYIGTANRLCIDGDEVEIDSFNMQLDELDAGRLLKVTATTYTDRSEQLLVATHPEAGVLGIYDSEEAMRLSLGTDLDDVESEVLFVVRVKK